MSEEGAFLEVLKANPADDTARLVYADWLDEHNEPVKAEYLRLVASIARSRDELAIHPASAQLRTFAKQLPEEWRNDAGSRFSLILYNYKHKVQTIIALRQIKGIGLGEAKAMSESLPLRIFDCQPFERVLAARNQLHKDEGDQILIHPHDFSPLPIRIVYSITAYRFVSEQASDPRTAHAQSVRAFADFLSTALQVPLTTAEKLALEWEATIEAELDANNYLARWNEFVNILPLDMPPDETGYRDNAREPDWQIDLSCDRHAIFLNR